MLITATTFGPIDFLAGLDALGDDLDTVEVVAVVDLPEAGEGRIPFADLLAGPALPEPITVDPSLPALVAYTSGTTADPKGVIHTHRSIGAETRQLSATKAADQPPNLVGLPVGHAMGMLGALLMPVQRGEPIHLTDVWNPDVVLGLMTEHGLSCGSGATYFLTSLLDHPRLTPDHLTLMRYVGLGGAAVPVAIAERATDAGVSIVRMYGSTEHPSITGSEHQVDPLIKRTTTDGRPLPGVEIRLVDAAGDDVPTGEPGEIISRGPDCFAGYTDAALTAEAFDDDGWFHTQDVGILDADGYLSITDRLKDVIIRGGENVSAVEVEELIARLPGVGEVAVVAGPDERLGERVCAFIRPGTEPPPDLEQVRDALRVAGLARQKWPEALYVVDDLPRTPSGKIQKAHLRARLQREHAATAAP